MKRLNKNYKTLVQAGEILLGLLICLSIFGCDKKIKIPEAETKSETIQIAKNEDVKSAVPEENFENYSEPIKQIVTKIEEEKKPAETDLNENKGAEFVAASENTEEILEVVIEKTSVNIPEKLEKLEKTEQKTCYNEERRNTMEIILSSTLGTIFYTITVFVAGALVGAPLWNWISAKLPWHK